MLGMSGAAIYESILEAPFYHLLFESILFMWVIWLLRREKKNPAEGEPLKPEEEQQILDYFQPKPLVHYGEKDKRKDEDILKDHQKERVVWDLGQIEGPAGKYVEVDGVKCLNLATYNYLGFVEEPSIKEETERCIRQYGVGSCGPRGFYGTVDVHLELEENIAKFLNLEEAALYSYSFAAISSAIPSYSKRGDVIFADEHVNFAIQRGLIASRSNIKYFKHNDFEDLRRLLEVQKAADVKHPARASSIRRFCVVEGIYSKTGTLCPLKEIAELCREHKVRLFVDESVSFGTLGKTGRGITEHLNVPLESIDFISGNLEHALGSFGGFIVGPSFVVDHQRISGLGYCFSASLPPMLAGAGIQAIKLLEQNPQYVEELQNNCVLMARKLESLDFFRISGHELSPIKHLRLAKSSGNRNTDKEILVAILSHAKNDSNIALAMPVYLEEEEHTLLPPSIRVLVNRLLTEDHINDVYEALRTAGNLVLADADKKN